MLLRSALIRLAWAQPELRPYLVPLVRTAGARPLIWSVDWGDIWDRIQVTYPITQVGRSWSVRDDVKGRSFSTPSRNKAIQQALEWFTDNLRQVAK